jgi:sugar phosphate isomerase/epimerase
MNDWPVGLSTGCFSQHEILDCLADIRHAGFAMVEVCSWPKHLDYHRPGAVRQVRTRMDDLGIEAYSFHAPFGPEIDISAPDFETRRLAVEEILRAAEAAAALRVRYLVIHPGPEQVDLADSPGRADRLRYAAEALRSVGEFCAQTGFCCVLENKLPHLLFARSSDLLWILAEMGTAAGVCLDTGHASLAGDPGEAARIFAGHLRMVHAHDNRGRGDDHLAPGTGTINWLRFLQALAAAEFRGGIIMEIAGREDRAILFQEARQSRLFLRELGRHLPRGGAE